MLWGLHISGLEVRQEGGETRLTGRFPYGQETILREAGDGGPELREVFAPRAFNLSKRQGHDIHLLAGHDFAKPVASIAARSLELTESDDGLVINARIDPVMAAVGYVADLVAGVRAGLVPGVSPGFRVARSFPKAEQIERRGNVILRTIREAILEEISIVTRPAYPQSQIEARSWSAAKAHAALTQDEKRALNQFWRYR